MKVKDFKPKYENIELIAVDEKKRSISIIGVLKFDKVKEKYGEHNVESVMNFDSTQSTSMIINKYITEEESHTEYQFNRMEAK